MHGVHYRENRLTNAAIITIVNSYVQNSNEVVVVDYQDLVNGVDVSAKIEKAFGAHKHCLGLLLVSNLPSEYLALRERLLKLASTFAALPEEAKDKTVHADSRYSFGWSCGKEIMNGKPGEL
ncbi:hypothetical protein BGZ58_010199 [Dissophora ornata]|nr:hypothetical protein BGZ58_010199 [Dissophora ornata]